MGGDDETDKNDESDEDYETNTELIPIQRRRTNPRITNSSSQQLIKLAELYKLADEGTFPKRTFKIGGKYFVKTAITQLWHVQTVHESLSDDVNLKFTCRACGFNKLAPFKNLTNLNKHRCCPEIVKW